MDTCTRDFMAAAQAGSAVHITDVRKRYACLPPGESFSLIILVAKIAGGTRRLELRLPRFAGFREEGRRFVTDFFLAQMYNILSSLGGRGITLVNLDRADEAEFLAKSFRHEFGVGGKRFERSGYGKSLNVVERILAALPGANGDMTFFFRLTEDEPEPEPEPEVSDRKPADMFAAATSGLGGKIILGIDIGGTDIKLALAVDNRLVCFKEYDWFPASFTTIDQMIDPVVALVKLMAFAAAGEMGDEIIRRTIQPGMRAHAALDDILTAVAAAEKAYGNPARRFDAIGMCFPDVVVDNKIVGGEVFKTRGIRDALGREYDTAFARLTDLDSILAPYVKKAGCVAIINDGPMAAFTAGIETAVATPALIADGVFAYTLGTELGTGWVTENGVIPEIPLEVYNFILDLGALPERRYEPDDLRSINNFNTRLPGTLQKFACQSGVFRMALKYFPEKRPDLLEEMRDRGFMVERETADGVGLYVPTSPKDMRKPFLEFMMGLVEREGDATVNRIFEEIGAALAVTGEEIDWILAPATRRRILFGRLVKKPECFALMRKGAAVAGGGTILAVADDGIAETPLMRALSGHPEYTVAQFAQAVGAIYYGNYRLGLE